MRAAADMDWYVRAAETSEDVLKVFFCRRLNTSGSLIGAG